MVVLACDGADFSCFPMELIPSLYNRGSLTLPLTLLPTLVVEGVESDKGNVALL